MAERFELYIIRHAQSANNALPESQRVEDPSITDVGQVQVQRLAERFRGIPITHALTSAFLRAVQTLEPLAEVVDAQPMIWTDLHEVGGCYRGYELGQIEGAPGMDRETLSLRFPNFQIPDDIDEHGWWKSKPYEDWAAAQRRADEQGQRLLNEFAGSDARVACVIHADFKDLLLRSMLKEQYAEFQDADLRNTGVTLLSCASTAVEVVEFNDVSHLSEDLITS